MHTYSIIRQRILKLAGMVLLLGIIAWVSIPLGKYLNRQKLDEDRIARIIEKKREEAGIWIDQLREGDFPDGKSAERLFRDQGLALFYRHDSLEWWSTHAVPLSEPWPTPGSVRCFSIPGNGYYLPVSYQDSTEQILALILIKRDYPYENRYLPNTSLQELNIPESFTIVDGPGECQVSDSDGALLFSLISGDNVATPLWAAYLMGLLWILAYVLLGALLYYVYFILITFRSRNFIMALGFALDMLILRGLIFWLRFPAALHDTLLFQPSVYAASWWIPSLGDLLLHGITLLWIAWALFRHARRVPAGRIRQGFLSWVIAMAGNILLIGFLMFNGYLFQSLVMDSSIHMSLRNPFALTGLSLLAYFTTLLFFTSYFLLAYRWVWLVQRWGIHSVTFLISLLVISMIYICIIGFGPATIILLVANMVFIPALLLHHQSWILSDKVSLLIFLVVGYAVMLSFLLHYHVDYKEKEQRKLLALRMTQSRDQVAEFLFDDIRTKTLQDTTFRRMVNGLVFQGGDETQLREYLRKGYFNEYWERFELMVTVCGPGRLLNVKPAGFVIECQQYFRDLVEHLGQPTGTDSLYFIDFGVDNSSYLAILPVSSQAPPGGKIHVFLEIYPKHIPRGMGYPELLVDETKVAEPLQEYTYAVYQNNELIRRVGRYYYHQTAGNYLKRYGDGQFFSEGGYVHYLKAVDEDTQIIISLPSQSLLDRMAPFSYILVSTILLLLVILMIRPAFIQRHARKIPGEGLSLRASVQLAMVAVVLVSFVVVAAASLWFLTRINQNKNSYSLSEKAHSVLVEMEHKLSDMDALGPQEAGRVQELLNKFSQVFFSDINMYATNGKLLASSRNRIFEEKLISTRMNAEAWDRLTRNQESMVILEERIGDYRYLSAYVPFRNNQNVMLAYLNLPYFARQAELRQEIAGFLAAIMNIYVILVALTLATALIVTGYITRPLSLIGEKIKRIRLGGANERIEWYRRDEIGRLVEEYNRMVDQLSESAELLASTEREMAWREMARQVAHEIKNPLTPMKLNVQYLQRAWDDKAADWNERLKRFTNTMTEQIDVLSDIASAFSDFARMPRSNAGTVDLAQVAMLAMETYRGVHHIHFQQQWEKSGTFLVNVDRNQLLRVFNNLIKNAIQAIGPMNGEVGITITRTGSFYRVSVSDTGPGIPEEKRDKIFTPNFTTKTSGMGLGLAIVRSTILSYGGEVWYETDEGKGTIFGFTLPAQPDEVSADGKMD